MLVEASPALFLKFELTRVTVTHAWFMGYGDFSCLLNELHALPVSPEIFVLVRHALLLGPLVHSLFLKFKTWNGK